VALSLTINILRVPYWGRAAETFGEDSYLTSQMAIAESRACRAST
jgi:beta-glucosidase